MKSVTNVTIIQSHLIILDSFITGAFEDHDISLEDFEIKITGKGGDEYYENSVILKPCKDFYNSTNDIIDYEDLSEFECLPNALYLSSGKSWKRYDIHD